MPPDDGDSSFYPLWHPFHIVHVMINMNQYLNFSNLILSLYPYLSMIKVEKNKVIRNDIIKLDNERTWISPTKSLSRKIVHYKALFLHYKTYCC